MTTPASEPTESGGQLNLDAGATALAAIILGSALVALGLSLSQVEYLLVAAVAIGAGGRGGRSGADGGEPVMSTTEPESEFIDAELAAELTDVIDAMESVEWGDVPGISSSTAAGFTRWLIEARQDVRRGRHA